jgi:hypothetical protein
MKIDRALRDLRAQNAERVRQHRLRRKAGIRRLAIEISELDLKALAQRVPQSDPVVDRVISAALAAAGKRRARKVPRGS